jgi:DNA invertase Pin-like site-specific DNA recombinase
MKGKTTAARREARARGRQGGRPKTLSAEEVKLLQDMYNKKEKSIPEICRQFQISKMTLYRYVRPMAKQQSGLSGLVHRLRGLGER